MNPLLTELLSILDLETLDRDRFRADCESSRHGRIFGGQVLAQALMAAGRTVDDRPVHSIQAFFLTAGDPSRPLRLEVERLRDGRSFSARRVAVTQGEDTLLTMQAAFHAEESGYTHQIRMPEAPPPESLPTAAELALKMRDRFPADSAGWAGKPRAVEIRHTLPPSYMGGEPTDAANLAWFRVEAELPDDPLLHECLLAYTSDIALNDSAYRQHRKPGEPPLWAMSSLDHAMWFHEPARADDWILYVQESPKAARARGFARGAMYRRSGNLIASVGQDSLMRPRP